MPFVKGQKRPEGAGRKKGQTFDRTAQSIEQLLKKHNMNLMDDLLTDLPHMSPETRTKVRLQLMEYQYPKLKASHVTGMPATSVSVQIANVSPTPDDKRLVARLLATPETAQALRLISDAVDADTVEVDANAPIKSDSDSHED